MAEACNIGLEPLIKHNIPALTRHRLSWVKQNYLRAETLVSANARLVDFESTLELAGHWGGGEVASADGMRFVTPVKTVNSGPNRKYFGSGRGITWYNFVSDQYSGFHGIVVPGTLRDSIFGLFWLLGYQFSPGLPMLAKRYSGEWINLQTTVHWMRWRGDVQICRRQRTSGMR